VLLGVATGAMFGLTAALMARMSQSLSGGLPGIFTVWQTYAMVATGLAAMYLLQNALQAGTLVAVQPGLTLTDPVVSILWGVVVFHERVRGGVWLLAAGLAFGLVVVGTVSLSRSPLIHAARTGPATPT
jgi:drug/metabolite transporter (DMT)-like permease